jgi:hypothetical protein
MDERGQKEAVMQEKLASYGFQAFCEVHTVSDFHSGILQVAKGHGLAGLRTNTIVFGWSEKEQGQIEELRTIRDLRGKGKSILLCQFTRDLPVVGKIIDIWWAGQQNNGDLMLLLAYLLKLNPQWENAEIRILSVVKDEEQKKMLEEGIKKLLPKTRIKASVTVIVSDRAFTEILHRNSGGSDMVFLGLPEIEFGEEARIAKNLDKLSRGLKATVFVQNNSLLDSIPILLKV